MLWALVFFQQQRLARKKKIQASISSLYFKRNCRTGWLKLKSEIWPFIINFFLFELVFLYFFKWQCMLQINKSCIYNIGTLLEYNWKLRLFTATSKFADFIFTCYTLFPWLFLTLILEGKKKNHDSEILLET